MAFRYGQIELNVYTYLQIWDIMSFRSGQCNSIQYSIELHLLSSIRVQSWSTQGCNTFRNNQVGSSIHCSIQYIYLQIWSNAFGFHFEFQTIKRLNIIWMSQGSCDIMNFNDFESEHQKTTNDIKTHNCWGVISGSDNDCQCFYITKTSDFMIFL